MPGRSGWLGRLGWNVPPWILIVVVHGLAILWWTSRNGLTRGPQNEFHQLLATAELQLCLMATDWECVALWTIQDYHPPLHRLGGVAALMLLPGAEDLLVATNIGWMTLLVFATWKMGQQLSGRATGTLAAILAASYPAMVGSYHYYCLLYTSPSPRDGLLSRMPSSA